MGKPKVTFIIGATATGKTYFIKNNFFNSDVVLDIYEYQQREYKNVGFDKAIPINKQIECLHKANEILLNDIVDNLKHSKNVVVEHTLFKAKRRIYYIDTIRDAVDANIEFYVMSPSDTCWDTYLTNRGLSDKHKKMLNDIEFPNPSEGIDQIFEVVDGRVTLRMDEPNPEIRSVALLELEAEAKKILAEREQQRKYQELLDSMNTRPFWHYCEVCGKKQFITAEEALDGGWDYPPNIGTFGKLSPRTCGECNMKDTLFWKVQQQIFPIIIEKDLTDKELETWKRIKGEPESLLTV